MSEAKALWDARYLLQRVAGTLEGAAGGLSAWWRGPAMAKALVEAETDLHQAADHLVDTPIPFPVELMERAEAWGDGTASAADLRADRDEVIALMGAVRFLLHHHGADEKKPDAGWFEKGTGGKGWDRVRPERPRHGKVGAAG